MDFWVVFGTACASALGTAVVGLIVNFCVSNSKKALRNKKELDKQELKETVKEVVDGSLEPIKEELHEIDADNKVLKQGLQSSIRVELRDKYEYWIKKGYASVSVRDDLEALYQSYHSLGLNGVMDSLREKFLALPVEQPKSKSNFNKNK